MIRVNESDFIKRSHGTRSVMSASPDTTELNIAGPGESSWLQAMITDRNERNF